MDTECLILCSGSYLISLELFRSDQQGLLAVFLFFVFIYLAALGLSCSMWDLVP